MNIEIVEMHFQQDILKLHEVGPVDNRPSKEYLHHYLNKKNIYIFIYVFDT